MTEKNHRTPEKDERDIFTLRLKEQALGLTVQR
jgi:hypothetical protein